jgi:hypothetical protein
MPYQLASDSQIGGERVLRYEGVPAGVVPIRVVGGAGYHFVEVTNVVKASDDDVFYNGRMQMLNLGEDKYILYFNKTGKEVLTLHLTSEPPASWKLFDMIFDSLDHTFIYGLQTGGNFLAMLAGGIVLFVLIWWRIRKDTPVQFLREAAIAGFLFAVLHGIYSVNRLGYITITSREIPFSLVSIAGTFLLAGVGGLIIFNGRGWGVKLVGLLVATFQTWASSLYGFLIITTFNSLYFSPESGIRLYTYSLSKMPLIAFLVVTPILILLYLFAGSLKQEEETSE